MRTGLWLIGLLALAAACGKQAGRAAVPSRLIEGRVIDVAGRPLAGATVHTPSADRLRRETVRTDAEGRFAAAVPADDPVVVLVTAEGHAFGLVGLPAGGGPLEIRLDLPHRVEVEVVSGRLEPVADVVVGPVASGRWDGRETLPDLPAEVLGTTDAAGRCRIECWPGRDSEPALAVLAPGSLYGSAQRPEWDAAGVAHVRHIVAPAVSVSGRVVLANGEPVAGAKVRFVQTMMIPLIECARPTWTREDGSFELGGANGAGDWLYVTPPPQLAELAPALSERLDTNGGVHLDRVELVLGSGPSLVVTVTDAETGRPVPGAVVSVSGYTEHDGMRGMSGPTVEDRTDAEGRLRIGGQPGPAGLTARRLEFPSCRATADLELVAGTTAEVALALKWTMPRFMAEVVDADGRPVQGADVYGCYTAGGTPYNSDHHLTADAQGRVTLCTERYHGLHFLAASPAGCSEHPVRALRDQTVRLVVGRPVLSTIAIKVTDQHGAPLAGAMVELDGATWQANPTRRQPTDRQGIALIGDVVPGLTCRIRANLHGHEEGRHPRSGFLFWLEPSQRHTAVTIVCRRRE